MSDPKALTFSGFTLLVDTNQLLFEGKVVAIEARQLQLLEVLANASPEMVSKQELMDILWPDTIVTEASLSRLISDTRKFLGTLGARRDLITTVHGRGFCLSAEVTQADASTFLHQSAEASGIPVDIEPFHSAVVKPGKRLSPLCLIALTVLSASVIGLVLYMVMAKSEPQHNDYVGTWQVMLQLKVRDSVLNKFGQPVCTDSQRRYDVVIHKDQGKYRLIQPQFTMSLGDDLTQPIVDNLSYQDAGGYVDSELTLYFVSHNRMTGHSQWQFRMTRDSEVICRGDSIFDAVK
ncbi:winged helix-turn-helix domain-containing protein [Shewanella sp. GXUN23E]|uniref:winged helix-turn-helix domain-containing protein n=1 Tax=Shewanella sp. GXUN23E TaxID=3422498 RepID=UPI003D7C5B5B